MELIFNPFSVSLLISGALVAALSAFISIKLGSSTRWIALTMLSASIWGFFYGLELASTSEEAMLFYVKLEYLGVLTTPTFWLIFSIKYTGLRPKYPALTYFFIGIIPLISYLILMTNELHHLHYASTSVNFNGPFPLLDIKIGPWYIVNVIYSYFAFLAGLIILWRRFRNSDPLYKTQTRLIFAAGVFPIIINVLYQLGLFRIYAEIDSTPFAFLFTYLILGFAIIRFSLFSIIPIAKEKIISVITRGVLVIDSRLNIIDYNPAAKDYFEKPQIIKPGNNLNEIFENFQPILDLVNSNKHQTIETPDTIREVRKIVRIESIPILDKKSSLSGTVLLFEDISEEVLTKEKLETQAKDLQQLNDLKDKYFSIISHDLKSPIFGIRELLHLTQSGDVSQEEFMEMIPEVTQNIENVSSLLENLLAWTSSQIKGEHIQLSEFNLFKVIEEQIQLVDRIAQGKSINIELADEGNILVKADQNMIELVLRNILSNAVKFSHRNGKIKINVSESGEFEKVCIEDFGIGISKENLKKLKHGISFSTKGRQNESGTGLGVLLVNEYTHKNNGRLEVSSELGKGTKFCIYIPKA